MNIARHNGKSLMDIKKEIKKQTRYNDKQIDALINLALVGYEGEIENENGNRYKSK